MKYISIASDRQGVLVYFNDYYYDCWTGGDIEIDSTQEVYIERSEELNPAFDPNDYWYAEPFEYYEELYAGFDFTVEDFINSPITVLVGYLLL